MQLDRTEYDPAPFNALGIQVCSLTDLGCEDEGDNYSLQVGPYRWIRSK